MSRPRHKPDTASLVLGAIVMAIALAMIIVPFTVALLEPESSNVFADAVEFIGADQ